MPDIGRQGCSFPCQLCMTTSMKAVLGSPIRCLVAGMVEQISRSAGLAGSRTLKLFRKGGRAFSAVPGRQNLEIAYLGIGSNIDRGGNIKRCLQMLKQRFSVKRVSSVYLTRPVGYRKQARFYNLAAMVETTLKPAELLGELQRIEKALGRKDKQRWGPRPIDLDILLYGHKVINSRKLSIPHPRMHQRAFALYPLAEIAPAARHPVLRKTIAELAGDVAKRKNEVIRKVSLTF